LTNRYLTLSLVKKIWSGRNADSSNYDYGGHKVYNYKYGGHKVYDYGGHPAPTGPALTYDLCGQNVKVKIKVKSALAIAEINKLAIAEINKLANV